MNKGTKKLTQKTKKTVKHTPDILLIIITLLILGFGIVMVYSASYYFAESNFNDPFKFVKQQSVAAIIGIIGMLFVTYFFNYRVCSNLKIAGIIYAVGLFFALSLPFIGTTRNGATRWIYIGPINFQPSELVKIGVIIMLSAYIVKFRTKLNRGIYVFYGMLIVLIPAAVVASENMSSAIVVAFIGFLILFVSTPKIWYYVLIIVLAVGVGGYIYYVAVTTESGDAELPGLIGKFVKNYQLDRIRVWEDPFIDPADKGYQPIQALYAVGSGGLFGEGLTKGIQKKGFLPEPHNDIIFAVICEELGLIGAMLLLIAYAILILRGLTIATHAHDLFGALVATGISGMIGIQVLLNVAVNTNSIPNTGMQLPLVSYGGTALVILLGSVGLLINISRTADISKP